MRSTYLASLASAALLTAACASSASGPEFAEAAPVADVVIGEAPAADARVTVNAPLKTDEAAQENRVVVSAMRSALRTSSLNAYLKALSDGSCPRGVASRSGDPIDITAMPIALNASNPAVSTPASAIATV